MKRAARLSTVLGVALLSVVACFSKPGRPDLTGDARMPDARPVDAAVPSEKIFLDAPKVFLDAPDAKVFLDAPTCGIAHDDFEASSGVGPCGNWATNPSTGGVVKTRNAHDVTISITGFQSAECISANPFKTAHGASVELVSSNLNGTYFRLNFPSGPQVAIFYQGTSLNLNCPGPNNDTTAPPIVSLPVYVRLTVAAAGTGMATVTAYYSATNGSWTMFNSCTFALATFDTAYGMFGGSGSSTTLSGTFDEFNTYDCPPP